MLAASDINGFISSDLVPRNKASVKGAAGTVDTEYFLYWVKEYLVTWLGKYERGDARSIVLVDNTSMHITDDVVDAITSAGAVVICATPYSPHLNQINNFIFYNKSYLKRN